MHTGWSYMAINCIFLESNIFTVTAKSIVCMFYQEFKLEGLVWIEHTGWVKKPLLKERLRASLRSVFLATLYIYNARHPTFSLIGLKYHGMHCMLYMREITSNLHLLKLKIFDIWHYQLQMLFSLKGPRKIFRVNI